MGKQSVWSGLGIAVMGLGGVGAAHADTKGGCVMRNFHGRQKGMRERPAHWWLCALLVLALLAALAMDAAAQSNPPTNWQPPTTKPPTQADLTMIQGRSSTVVIRLLNLSPYELVGWDMDPPIYKDPSTIDKNRCTHKSFPMLPVGEPDYMPGLQGTWSQDPNTFAWVFTPSNTNRSTHPLNFVVSWDDQGGYVTNSSLTYVMYPVYPVGHGPTKENVYLRLYFTRVKPSDALRSEVFQYDSKFIVALVDIIGVITDPGNPIAWLDAFVATKELADGTLELWNTDDTGNDKMYFGAYTLPDTDCTGCLGPAAIVPSTSGETTDGVAAQWESLAGDYASNVVVTTQVIRGKDPHGTGYRGFQDFRLPIVNVTVWDPGEFKWAQTKAAAAATAHPLGQRLNAALGTRDLSRYTQFLYLSNSLNPSQHRTFQATITAFLRGDPLTHQQEVLIEKLIAALEKGQTKLSPDNREPVKGDSPW